MEQIVTQKKKQSNGINHQTDGNNSKIDTNRGEKKEGKKKSECSTTKAEEIVAKPAGLKQTATVKTSPEEGHPVDKQKPGKKRLIKKARLMETAVTTGSRKRLEDAPSEEAGLEDPVPRKESKCKH